MTRDSRLGRLPGRAPVDSLASKSAFPPIADYGFLSDCETTALVAPSGNVEWLCLPRLDSPERLRRDARPGCRRVPARARRRHRARPRAATCPGTHGAGDELGHDRPAGSSCATCCSWARGTTSDELSQTHRRAPTDYDAEHVLLRTVRCVNGEVQVALDCEPVFDYGRRRGDWEYTDRGYHQGVARPTASTSSCS